MKRILHFLLMSLCLALTASAQDFEPGQQAQGLLESKNVTVDYATGLFHYKVPLYTLKSGEYELPITLDYTSKGVKQDDNAGLYGHNWTLNTGGVVTRTVRGGIPDESRPYGYVWTENSTIPLLEDLTKVNQHKRDGECDIFTAVFGGQKVDFIVRKDATNKLYAEPLQRTDVKIECESVGGTEINGWVVTDAVGNRYTFRQKGWTDGASTMKSVSLNGVRNLQYTSSWYLTCIEPVNCEAIVYHYRGSDQAPLNSTYYHIVPYSNTFRTRYAYGKPMVQRTFNNPAYKQEFDEAIDQAMFYLQDENIQLQVETQMMAYDTISGWHKNPEYDLNTLIMEQNSRVLGMVSDFHAVTGASEELMVTLANLKMTYETTNWNASHWFDIAYGVLEDMLADVEYVTERTVNNMTSFRVFTPKLTGISCGEQVLFEYGSRLSGITVKSRSEETVSGCTIAYSGNKISSVCTYGTDLQGFARTAFSYYTEPGSTGVMSDPYGYQTLLNEDPFHNEPNGDYAKIGSLKEITTPDGGRVRIDYEQNFFADTPYGGIRIKSLVLDNQAENRTDTVHYSYGSAIPTFYECYGNYREFDHGFFEDAETYTHMQFRDMSLLCPGNNGLYYTYVTESVSGRGSQRYEFSVPGYHSEMVYPYWACALPMITFTFDEEGYLKRVLAYQYYTDTFAGDVPDVDAYPDYSDGVFYHKPACYYRNALQQAQLDDRYMDEADLDSRYRNMDNLVLNGQTYYNPYNDFYLVNIKPRIPDNTHAAIKQGYKLLYGGATLLKGVSEIRIEDNQTLDNWSLDPNLRPYSQTFYYYDNLEEHVSPTRMVRYDSKGDSTVTYFRRVADMAATAGTSIAELKELNAVSPVVKQTVVKNGKLQQETVSEYHTATSGGKRFYGVSRQKTYTPESVVSVTSVNDSPCSYAESLYRTELTYSFDSIGSTHYLPVEVEEKNLRTACFYDSYTKWLQVKAENCGWNQLQAADGLRYREAMEHRNLVAGNAPLVAATSRFMQDVKAMEAVENPFSNYDEFRQSQEGVWSFRLLELLAASDDWEDSYTEEATGLLDNLAGPDSLYLYLEEFVGMNMMVCALWQDNTEAPSPYSMTAEEIQWYMQTIVSAASNGNLREHFASLGVLQEGSMQIEPLEVPLEEHTRWKLYLLLPAGEHTVSYRIGNVPHSRSLTATATTPLQVVDIDAGTSASGSTLELTGFGNAAFVALVPAGVTFEATHYDSLGRIVAKFDQSLNLERYEYDAAGRQTKITDRNGKIIQENQYNTLND